MGDFGNDFIFEFYLHVTGISYLSKIGVNQGLCIERRKLFLRKLARLEYGRHLAEFDQILLKRLRAYFVDPYAVFLNQPAHWHQS